MSQLVTNRLFDNIALFFQLKAHKTFSFRWNLGVESWYRKMIFPFFLYSIESVIMLLSCSTRGEEKLLRISGKTGAVQKCRLLRIVKRVESLVDPLVGAVIRGRIISASNRSDWTVLSFGKFWRNCRKIGWIGFSFTPICLLVYRDNLFSSSSTIELISFFIYIYLSCSSLFSLRRNVWKKKKRRKWSTRSRVLKLFSSSKNLGNIEILAREKFFSFYLLFWDK